MQRRPGALDLPAGRVHAHDAPRPRGEAREDFGRRATEMEQAAATTVAELGCQHGDQFSGIVVGCAVARCSALGSALGPASFEHRLDTLAVGPQHRIVKVDLRQQARHEIPAGTFHRRPVVHPVLLAEFLQQADVAKQLEMPRHARLALAEDLRQLGDRKLTLGEDGEQAQSGGFGHGAELVQEGVKVFAHLQI